jgi:hypothetical protein
MIRTDHFERDVHRWAPTRMQVRADSRHEHSTLDDFADTEHLIRREPPARKAPTLTPAGRFWMGYVAAMAAVIACIALWSFR